MEPEPTWVIGDPACGTGGFLVSVMEHLQKKYTSQEGRMFETANGEEVVTYTGDLLEPYREHIQSGMFHGFDFDVTMLRIAAMNLMLHGVDTPDIHYQDTLSSNFPERFPRYASDCFDLVLANPPFKGSLDEEDVHSSLTGKVKTKKTELLFLVLMLRMLTLGGRCAVIVPDGVLFGSSIAREVSAAMQRCLALRTSTAQVDLFSASSRRVRLEEPMRLRTRFAMRFGDQDAEDSNAPTRADQVRSAFNSPFWPFVLATTSVGQEGLDFHPYCHAVVHWNLPSNPVDLEQREGRVHRYKGHALRKNIADANSATHLNGNPDIWSAMFSAARAGRPAEHNDLFPYWITSDGAAKIERHVPALPHSRDIPQGELLRRSLVTYRMVFGQNRQEDLVRYLLEHVPEDRIAEIVDLCRLSLAPVTQAPLLAIRG